MEERLASARKTSGPSPTREVSTPQLPRNTSLEIEQARKTTLPNPSASEIDKLTLPQREYSLFGFEMSNL